MTGTVCVITNAAGQAFATGIDVEQGRPAGFSLTDIQEDRAKAAAWRDVWAGACHPDVARAISESYSASRTLEAKMITLGWKATCKTFEFEGAA